MGNIIHRPYLGGVDDIGIRSFLSQAYAQNNHPYFSIDPPNWERIRASAKSGSTRRKLQLWESCEQSRNKIVGMLEYHSGRCQFSYRVDPAYQQIAADIVGWVESADRAASEESKNGKVLSCSVCEQSKDQQSLLAELGYSKTEKGSVFRVRSLRQEVPKRNLFPGYRILELGVLSTHQYQDRVQQEREIFGDPVSAALLRELQKAPIYRPDLDLVIITRSGELAAFCTIWYDTKNQAGYFEPVATAPAHRRRGLGKAMLVEGLQRLKRIGATKAYLGHDADNAAGIRLYDSVGLTVFDQEYWWQKQSD